MTRRAVYDAMVFFQWAALPADRQHGTVKALYDGKVRLCLSAELVAEVLDLLTRPNIRVKAPNLTGERVATVVAAAAKFADWFQNVPNVFTFPQHPDDDHLFNLAIAAKADYLVTWETRILKLAHSETATAQHLRSLAPNLSIVDPKRFAEILKSAPPEPPQSFFLNVYHRLLRALGRGGKGR